MIEFNGWLLPVQYSSILDEHRAVRRAVGAFDVSHLGEIEVGGRGAFDFLQRVVTSDLSRLDVGRAQYGLLCRPDGGILDDVYVYRLSDRYFVVVNAATTARSVAWLREQLGSSPGDVRIDDVTDWTTTISVQGPAALAAIQPIVEAPLGDRHRAAVVPTIVAGRPMLVARTGYAGESGVEVFPAAGDAETVWDAILSQTPPIRPCGLGARDTLRLEAGNRLYGHDLDESTNPVEAGLEWAVSLEKGDFIGRDAIRRAVTAGVTRRLVGFRVDERVVAREGCPVLEEGRAAGVVTSGSFAPSLGYNIGFAYVPTRLSQVGTALTIDVRGRQVRAEVVRTPFYRRRRGG